MIYSGFTKDEIKKIIELLEKMKVSYEITPYQDAIDAVNQAMKFDLRHLQGSSLDPSMLQLEIPDTELRKIPRDQYKRLEDLRIFPDVDSIPTMNFDGIDESLPQTMVEVQRKGFVKSLGHLYLGLFLLFGLSLVAVLIYEFTRK